MLNEPAAPGEPSMEELAAQMGGAGQTAVCAPGHIMPFCLSDCRDCVLPHSLMHGFSAICLAWAGEAPSAAQCMAIAHCREQIAARGVGADADADADAAVVPPCCKLIVPHSCMH